MGEGTSRQHRATTTVFEREICRCHLRGREYATGKEGRKEGADDLMFFSRSKNFEDYTLMLSNRGGAKCELRTELGTTWKHEHTELGGRGVRWSGPPSVQLARPTLRGPCIFCDAA